MVGKSVDCRSCPRIEGDKGSAMDFCGMDADRFGIDPGRREELERLDDFLTGRAADCGCETEVFFAPCSEGELVRDSLPCWLNLGTAEPVLSDV